MSTNMGEEKECNIGLALGISGISNEDHYSTSKKRPHVQFHILFPPKSEGDGDELGDKGGGGGGVVDARKKLKLTKEQSTLLEDSFREHQTLNLAQKQELADRLKLRPRQVEVWFQNRRARNKLKQTEVDCERLLKWCESLSTENRRLNRELQELRSAKLTRAVEPPNASTAAPVKAICPSCQHTVLSTDGSSSVVC